MKIIFWPKDSLLMRWKHFPNWNRKLYDLKSHRNTQNDFGPDKGPDETLLWMQILWWEVPTSVRCCQGSTCLWVEYRPIKIKGIFQITQRPVETLGWESESKKEHSFMFFSPAKLYSCSTVWLNRNDKPSGLKFQTLDPGNLNVGQGSSGLLTWGFSYVTSLEDQWSCPGAYLHTVSWERVQHWLWMRDTTQICPFLVV